MSRICVLAFPNLTGANLFPAEFYFLSRLPSDVNPREVATIVGMALILSLIATLYPVLARGPARSGRGASL